MGHRFGPWYLVRAQGGSVQGAVYRGQCTGGSVQEKEEEERRRAKEEGLRKKQNLTTRVEE